MFGSLGAPEVILIFIVALIVFGPKRLPEIGRKIGGIVRDLRRATGDFRESVEREIGFDPSNVGDALRGRRDLLNKVSDPLRDMAAGAAGAVRDVRDAVILPPGAAGWEPSVPPGTVPGPPPRPLEPPSEGPPAEPPVATPARGGPQDPPASSLPGTSAPHDPPAQDPTGVPREEPRE